MPSANPLRRLLLVATGISLLATGCAHSVPSTPPRPSTPIRPGPAGPIAPQSPAAPQAPVAPVAPIRPAASMSPSPISTPTADLASTPPTVYPVRAFRCALDNRPGMLVMDLGDGLFAAWDTRQGFLYNVWSGDVYLTGTVYDTRHGPRPYARGTAIYAALPTALESEVLATRPTFPPPPPELLSLAHPDNRQWVGHRVETDSIVLIVRHNGTDQRITFQRNTDRTQFPLAVTIR